MYPHMSTKSRVKINRNALITAKIATSSDTFSMVVGV